MNIECGGKPLTEKLVFEDVTIKYKNKRMWYKKILLNLNNNSVWLYGTDLKCIGIMPFNNIDYIRIGKQLEK